MIDLVHIADVLELYINASHLNEPLPQVSEEALQSCKEFIDMIDHTIDGQI